MRKHSHLTTRLQEVRVVVPRRSRNGWEVAGKIFLGTSLLMFAIGGLVAIADGGRV